MAKHRVKDELLNHDYDGIREYDNDLPPWWLWLFYVTIAIAVVYVFHYHILKTGDINAGTLKAQTISDGLMHSYQSPWQGAAPMAQAGTAPAAAAAGQAKAPAPAKEEKIPRITDPARLDHGAQVFAKNCVPCHGDKGQGIIGPNLTDEYWLHGGTMTDVVHTITYGVPAKGMIPWGGTLSRDDILDVAGFILERLQGTHPPNAKPPQGVKVTS